MATDILGLETNYTTPPQPYSAPQIEMVHGALEAQGLAALQILVAGSPDGGVVKIPDDSAWEVSASGVVSPGAGIATHSTYKALALQTTAPVTIDGTTAGFEASASGLYLFAAIEAAANDSRKTRLPKFVLSDSPTLNGGILIASGVSTDSDGVTAASDAREFIEFEGEGGASTPTGTGVVKVVSGVQQAAASLIANADIAADAAIAQSKISGLATALGAKSDAAHTHSNATDAASGFMSAADKLKLNSATDANIAGALAMRDSNGNLKASAPVAGSDVATKDYADSIAAAGAPDATETTAGIAKLSVAPVAEAIAVGNNDSRLQVMGASGSGHSAGIVDSPGATPGSTRFWREDAVWVAPTAGLPEALNFIMDSGGSELETGVQGDFIVGFDCEIQSVTLLADQTGGIVLDLWRETYANYPATDADSITASAPPTISAGIKSQDSSLTGWTVALNAGDVLRVNVDSVTDIARCTLFLQVVRT